MLDVGHANPEMVFACSSENGWMAASHRCEGLQNVIHFPIADGAGRDTTGLIGHALARCSTDGLRQKGHLKSVGEKNHEKKTINIPYLFHYILQSIIVF